MKIEIEITRDAYRFFEMERKKKSHSTGIDITLEQYFKWTFLKPYQEFSLFREVEKFIKEATKEQKMNEEATKHEINHDSRVPLDEVIA